MFLYVSFKDTGVSFPQISLYILKPFYNTSLKTTLKGTYAKRPALWRSKQRRYL